MTISEDFPKTIYFTNVYTLGSLKRKLFYLNDVKKNLFFCFVFFKLHLGIRPLSKNPVLFGWLVCLVEFWPQTSAWWEYTEETFFFNFRDWGGSCGFVRNVLDFFNLWLFYCVRDGPCLWLTHSQSCYSTSQTKTWVKRDHVSWKVWLREVTSPSRRPYCGAAAACGDAALPGCPHPRWGISRPRQKCRLGLNSPSCLRSLCGQIPFCPPSVPCWSPHVPPRH